MALAARLLELLCCPAEEAGVPCHGALEETAEGLRCLHCGRIYPVEDGIPVLLADQARRP